MKKIDNTYKGRIVHLPYLGNDPKLWISVIDKCTLFLKSKGCCMVSGISINEMFRHGLYKSGYVKIKKHQEPMYIKDKDGIMNSFDFKNWYFQFSDGDLALRNY